MWFEVELTPQDQSRDLVKEKGLSGYMMLCSGGDECRARIVDRRGLFGYGVGTMWGSRSLESKRER
jgi:hypothetical protein